VKRLFASAYVVVMDDAGTEHEDGWVLVEDGVVAATGGGAEPDADERVDLGGAIVTPGLINTHHHLYQTLTRARAQESNLFGWLKALYPVWARLDEEAEHGLDVGGQGHHQPVGARGELPPECRTEVGDLGLERG